VVLPEEPAWARSNWQSFSVRLPDGAGQRAVMQAMRQAGVATTRGVMCAHRQGAYARQGSWRCADGPGECGCEPGSCRRLRHSELATDRCLILPLYHQMSEGDQRRVAAALESAL
jgi:dTDP-4-amino-4,6-dideoxygalactose transaminase